MAASCANKCRRSPFSHECPGDTSAPPGNKTGLRTRCRIVGTTVRRVREVEYESRGVPLEDYQLTRRDHRWQKDLEAICRAARRQVEQHFAQLREDPEMAARDQEARTRVLQEILSCRTPDHLIMRWRVRLYCGHITETTRHAENAQPTLHGSSKMRCPECGQDPSAIVAFEPIGLVAEPSSPPTPSSPPPSRKPTRAELERRVAALEAENARLRTSRSSG